LEGVSERTPFSSPGIETDLNDIPYAKGARYEYGKQCLPGTRVEILDEITNWIMNTDDTRRVCLVAGAAGVGKSAIAHTIAGRFDKIGRLASSFCFSRNDLASRKPELVFPTLARDLAGYDPSVKKALGDIVHNQPSLRNTRDLQDQFDNLILKSTHDLSVAGPLVVVIDALDESGDAPSRRKFLSVLTKNIVHLPTNFRILITSRAENDVLEYFNTAKTLHIDNPNSFQGSSTNKDIFTYICAQLVDSKGQRLPDLDDTCCQALVDKSEGLFQWAFVACKAITGEGKGGSTPLRRYQRLLASLGPVTSSLDSLYTQVLSQIFDTNEEAGMVLFRSIMGLVLTVYEPLSIPSLKRLWYHHEDGREAHESDDDVSSVLKFMGSLLSGTFSDDVVVRPLHTSFRDYLTDPQRSGVFCVQTTVSHAGIALACLGVLNTELHFNICCLETLYVKNSQVTDLRARVKQCILPHLSYACRFWGRHFTQITTSNFMHDHRSRLQIFLPQKSLYWLEALSLIQSINIAHSCLSDGMAWMKVNIFPMVLMELLTACLMYDWRRVSIKP